MKGIGGGSERGITYDKAASKSLLLHGAIGRRPRLLLVSNRAPPLALGCGRWVNCGDTGPRVAQEQEPLVGALLRPHLLVPATGF